MIKLKKHSLEFNPQSAIFNGQSKIRDEKDAGVRSLRQNLKCTCNVFFVTQLIWSGNNFAVCMEVESLGSGDGKGRGHMPSPPSYF